MRGLLRFWPLTNSHKEVLFLGELEEVLELTQVCQGVGRCIFSGGGGGGGQKPGGLLPTAKQEALPLSR